MNSKRVYQIGFLALIAINTILIYLLLTKQDRPPRGQWPQRGSIIEKISARLELTETQESDYRLMAKRHGDQMRSFDQDHKELIKAYFKSFSNSTSSDSIKREILKLESNKLQLNYKHFEELKSMLNEEQKNRFGLIMNDILAVLGNDRSNRPPPPRDYRN